RISQKNLEEEFSRKYPKFIALRNPKLISLDELQKEILRPDEGLISFWVGEDYLFSLFADKNRSLFLFQPIEKKALEFRVETLRALIDAKADVETFMDASYKLYQDILEPFQETFSEKTLSTLFIIPQGTLAKLPFEALIQSKEGKTFKDLNYFFRSKKIGYCPSAMVLREIRKSFSEFGKASPATNPAILFGDPVYSEEQGKEILDSLRKRGGNAPDGFVPRDSFSITDDPKVFQKCRAFRVNERGDISLNPLPGSRVEVESISELFYHSKIASNTHTGFEASESLLKELSEKGFLSTFRYLHFAAHGILPQGSFFSEPCIALSTYGADTENGLLQMNEIFGLRINAQLVTLSACETGIEETNSGNQGINGLARAFFYAGTPRVMVSLWSISDIGTGEFMKVFYRELLEPTVQPRFFHAMNNARESMLNGAFSHPFFWAPFALLGDGNE
ncbi:CHAT domain-containing protein, partial [bacterium]|nr:CHAT domain-containing protein [bacterium]